MKRDGGPAYPSHGSMGEVTQEGMTMRQYYKAAALTGLSRAYPEGTVDDFGPREVASEAAYLADAMIAEDEEHAK